MTGDGPNTLADVGFAGDVDFETYVVRVSG